MTKAEDIAQKISPSLTPEFFEGKRDLEEFEDLLVRLRDNGEISKEDYQYARKNIRHVLLGLKLFYLVKEIYDDRNTPTVFIQVSALMARRLFREGKVKSLEEATKILSDQMNQTVGTPMTSFHSADTVNEMIHELKKEVLDLYQKKDVKGIQRIISRVKDNIIESVGSSAILHDLDRYSRELGRSGLPDYYDILEKLDEWVERTSSS